MSLLTTIAFALTTTLASFQADVTTVANAVRTSCAYHTAVGIPCETVMFDETEAAHIVFHDDEVAPIVVAAPNRE